MRGDTGGGTRAGDGGSNRWAGDGVRVRIPRQRLDVIVNILTNLAVQHAQDKGAQGTQQSPNIHIDDMVRAYELLGCKRRRN